MTPRRWLLVLACHFVGAGLLPAQTSPAAEPSPIRERLGKLIREDAARQYSFLKPVEASPGKNPAEETVELPTFVVREKRLPSLPPPLKETQLQEFFRTGTLLET